MEGCPRLYVQLLNFCMQTSCKHANISEKTFRSNSTKVKGIAGCQKYGFCKVKPTGVKWPLKNRQNKCLNDNW